jgi:hypothetical protein
MAQTYRNRATGGSQGAAGNFEQACSSSKSLYSKSTDRNLAVRASDRAAPINAAAARRRLLARSVPTEPRRPTLADIERMLEVLPYGRWIARDGRVIIFNRGYQPIWERLPNGEILRANGGEWIDWVDQGWFGLGSVRYEKSAREAYRKVFQDFFDGKPLIVKSEIP